MLSAGREHRLRPRHGQGHKLDYTLGLPAFIHLTLLVATPVSYPQVEPAQTREWVFTRWPVKLIRKCGAHDLFPEVRERILGVFDAILGGLGRVAQGGSTQRLEKVQ